MSYNTYSQKAPEARPHKLALATLSPALTASSTLEISCHGLKMEMFHLKR